MRGKNTIRAVSAPYPLRGEPKASNRPQSLSNDVGRYPTSFDSTRGRAGCLEGHRRIRREPLIVQQQRTVSAPLDPLHGERKATDRPQSPSNDVGRYPTSFDSARGRAGCPEGHRRIRREPLIAQRSSSAAAAPIVAQR